MVLGIGLLLWTINFVYNRPIFLDEANLARNLYDRSFSGLFRPLDHEQYGPPLYLVICKGLAELFGYREYILRLPAMLGGCLALAALYRAGRSLQLGYWCLLPLALLIVNPTVLRYVTEFKPYGLDLGVAAFLLSWQIARPRGNTIRWTLAGVILPWLSLPSVFVLATIGLLRLRDNIRWVLVIGAWLLSFASLYLLVLRPSVGSAYLNNFHAEYFMPLPSSWENLERGANLIFSLGRLSFGFTIIALLWGAFTFFGGLWSTSIWKKSWLLLPLVITLAASNLKLYTLIDRLMLFALPGVWLFIALSARWIYARASGWWKWVYLVLIVITLGGTNIYRAMLRPYRFNDSRRLAEVARESPVFLADRSAVPVLDYYLRVKPGKAGGTSIPRPSPDGNLPRGDFSILFDGTNYGPTQMAIKSYENRAAERGCKTAWEEMYRSGSLYIKCP